jgi:hypothetical protein
MSQKQPGFEEPSIAQGPSDDDLAILLKFQGFVPTSTSSGCAGTHANLITKLTKLVNFAHCARGNHSWIRDPAQQGIRMDPRTGKFLGSVTHKCNICEASIQFGAQSSPKLEELIPTAVVARIRMDVLGLPKSIMDSVTLMKESSELDDYKYEEDGKTLTEAFESGNKAVVKLQPKVEQLAISLGANSLLMTEMKNAVDALRSI